MKPSRNDLWKIVFGLAAVLAMGIVLAPSVRAAFAIVPLLSQARWPWFLAALLCQAIMYACVAQILAVSLSTLGIRASQRDLYVPAVVFLFANRAVPGPAVAGLASLVYLLGRRGVTPTDAQVAASSFYLADYASFFLVIVFAATTMIGAPETALGSVRSYGIATAIILALFIFCGVAYGHGENLIRMGGRIAGWAESRLRQGSPASVAEKLEEILLAFYAQSVALLRNRRVLGILIVTGIVMHLLEACTIVCAARGFGGGLSFAAAMTGYVAGNLAAIVSFLPGGVGLYDGAMITVLHAAGHLSLPIAGATTIAYRLVSIALPFPFAIAIIRPALKRSRHLDGDLPFGDHESDGSA